jgi:hypothetical protein
MQRITELSRSKQGRGLMQQVQSRLSGNPKKSGRAASRRRRHR